MKFILLTLFFILINFIGVSAQINQTSLCPTIYMSGQSFIPKSGEPMIFTVTISEEAKMYNIKYIWTVKRGEILAGQGTSSIKTTWENSENSILASVKIIGLPENCDNTVSEIIHYTPAPEPEKIDEFLLTDKNLFKIKNNKLIDGLKNDLSAQLYVIFYFKRNSSQKSTEQKMQKIENYLINVNKIDKERITKLKVFSEKQESVQFWITPTGAIPPTPEKR